MKNIAYKNDTSKEVNKHIRKLLNKTDEYEVGEVLICREYLKLKTIGVFNVNYKYNIIEVSPKTLTITHINEPDVKYIVPLNIIRNKFLFNYCATCHSVQGSTIRENITIFDWKFYFTSRKWIYTAVTRADNWNNVYFYDYVEPEFNKNLEIAYFNKKIVGYKSQDKEAGIKFDKDKYINVDWLITCKNSVCSYCSIHFILLLMMVILLVLLQLIEYVMIYLII